MKMNRYLLTTLATGLLPLAALAEEMPLWEIRARMDAGGNTRIHDWLEELLDGERPAWMDGKAVLRVAGVKNAETPGEGWVAELSGIADPGGFLSKLAENAVKDNRGRFRIKEEDAEFMAWQDEAGALRFASPAENADMVVTPLALLEGDAWLAGWVGLASLSKPSVESTTLKLPEQLSFTFSGGGPGVMVEFRAGLGEPGVAEAAQTLLKKVALEFSSGKEGEASGVPKLEFKANDKTLTARVIFSGSQLDVLLEEISKAVEEP